MHEFPAEQTGGSLPGAQPPEIPELPGAVLIGLRIEPGEPIAGTITARGQTTSTSFCGWMELIAEITARREG